MFRKTLQLCDSAHIVTNQYYDEPMHKIAELARLLQDRFKVCTHQLPAFYDDVLIRISYFFLC